MKWLHALLVLNALAVVVITRAHADDLAAPPMPLTVLEKDRMKFVLTDKRANFRAGVMGWIYERNTALGWISDFALPGSELPLHLDVDPGDKEFVLAWEFRFR